MGTKSKKFLPFPIYSMLTYATIILGVVLWQGKTCWGDKNVTFNKNTTGVTFSVYVRNNINGTKQNQSSYSLEDVETMIKVISKKFSKIATFGVGADNEPYKYNVTYYNHSKSQIFAGEAAARVNLEMEKNNSDWTPIEMYVGIHEFENLDQLKIESRLANESLWKANKIFNNTVTALVFNFMNINETIARQTLDEMKLLKKDLESKNKVVKIGSRQSCKDLNSTATNTDQKTIFEIRKEMIELTNFTICDFPVFTTTHIEENFARLKDIFISYKNEIEKLNKNMEVMLQTGISGNSDNDEELEALQSYWKNVDKWATEMKITVWMHEAIDNPSKNASEAHLGLWKLTDNAPGNTDSYREKFGNVSNGPEKIQGNPKNPNSPNHLDDELPTTFQNVTTAKPAHAPVANPSGGPKNEYKKPQEKSGVAGREMSIFPIVFTMIAIAVLP